MRRVTIKALMRLPLSTREGTLLALCMPQWTGNTEIALLMERTSSWECTMGEKETKAQETIRKENNQNVLRSWGLQGKKGREKVLDNPRPVCDTKKEDGKVIAFPLRRKQ